MVRKVIPLVLLVVTLATLVPNLAVVTYGGGGTEVHGVIEGNVVWTPDKSPYIITKNLEIRGNLTIEPGVEVLVRNYVIIIIKGRLVAEGTRSKPVVIKSINSTSTKWYFSIEDGGKAVFKNALVEYIRPWVFSNGELVLINTTVKQFTSGKGGPISKAFITIENSKLGLLHFSLWGTPGELSISNSRIGNLELGLSRADAVIKNSVIGTFKVLSVWGSGGGDGWLFSRVAIIGTSVSNFVVEGVREFSKQCSLLVINSSINSVSTKAGGFLVSSWVVVDNSRIGSVSIRSYESLLRTSKLMLVGSRVGNVVVSTVRNPLDDAFIVISNSSIGKVRIYGERGLYESTDFIISSTYIEGWESLSGDESCYISYVNLLMTNASTKSLKITNYGIRKSNITIKYSRISNGYGIYLGNLMDYTKVIMNYNSLEKLSVGLVVNRIGHYGVVLNISNNWWGDPSGPYVPVLNPKGKGCKVEVPPSQASRIVLSNWLSRPPRIRIAYPSIDVVVKEPLPALVKNPVDLSRSKDPDGRVVYYVLVPINFGHPVLSKDPVINVVFPRKGTYLLYVYVVDNDGLVAKKALVLKVSGGALLKSPKIHLTEPSSKEYLTGRDYVIVRWRIDNAYSAKEVVVYVNGRAVKTLEPSSTGKYLIELPREGRYDIKVAVVSKDGKVTYDTLSVITDFTPPTIHLSTDAVKYGDKVKLHIKWLVSDERSGVSRVEVYVNNKLVKRTAEGRGELIVISDKDVNTVKVVAMDKVGNTALCTKKVPLPKETKTSSTTTETARTVTTPSTRSTPKETPTTSVTVARTTTGKSVTTSIQTPVRTTTKTRKSATQLSTQSISTSTTTHATTGAPITLLGAVVAIIVIVAVAAIILKRR